MGENKEKVFLYLIILFLIIVIGIIVTQKPSQVIIDSSSTSVTKTSNDIDSSNNTRPISDYKIIVRNIGNDALRYIERGGSEVGIIESKFEGYIELDNKYFAIDGEGEETEFNVKATNITVVVQSESQSTLKIELFKDGKFFDEVKSDAFKGYVKISDYNL